MSAYYYTDYPVPDLCYDHHDLPSPPSATASNVVPTPPLDWQPWDAHTAPKPDLVWPLDDPWLLDDHHVPALDPTSILFSSYQQPAPPPPPPPAQSGARYTHVSPAATVLAPPRAAPTHPAPAPTAPTAPAPQQPALKLHQPRPSRKIPIVNLSKLALACDDFQTRPKQPRDTFPGEAGPLPFRTSPSKPYHPMAYYSSNQYHVQPKFDAYGIPFPGHTATLIHCSCGCMTPSTCR